MDGSMGDQNEPHNSIHHNHQYKLELIREYEVWREKNVGVFSLASCSVGEDGSICLKFGGNGGQTFILHCPCEVYEKEGATFVEAEPPLPLWSAALNEHIMNLSTFSLENILDKAASLYEPCKHSVSVSSESDDSDSKTSDEESSMDLTSMMEQFDEICKDSTCEKSISSEMIDQKEDNIDEQDDEMNEQFSQSSGKSPILEKNFLAISKVSCSTGIRVKTVQGNIYLWNVFFSHFNTSSLIHNDILELKRLFGYDFVQLHFDFTANIDFPFPPIIRVVRPRLADAAMFKFTSFLEIWNPALEILPLLEKIKTILENHVRIEVNNLKNGWLYYRNGSYSEVEDQLQWLANIKERGYYICNEANCEKSHHEGFLCFRPNNPRMWNPKNFVRAVRSKDPRMDQVLQKIIRETTEPCSLSDCGTSGWCGKAWNIDLPYKRYPIEGNDKEQTELKSLFDENSKPQSTDGTLTSVSGETEASQVLRRHVMPLQMATRELIAFDPEGKEHVMLCILPVLHFLMTTYLFTKNSNPFVVVLCADFKKAFRTMGDILAYAHETHSNIVFADGEETEETLQKATILVTAPEELLNLLGRDCITLSSTRFIILNEADKFTNMDLVDQIMNHPSLLMAVERQTVIFSATFSDDVHKFVAEFFRAHLCSCVERTYIESITQTLLSTPLEDKAFKVLDILCEGGGEQTLILSLDNIKAYHLEKYLNDSGFSTGVFFDKSNLPDVLGCGDNSLPCNKLQVMNDNRAAVDSFEVGLISALVTTHDTINEVHIAQVDHLIFYDFPKTVLQYDRILKLVGRFYKKFHITLLYDHTTDVNTLKDLQMYFNKYNNEFPDWLSAFICIENQDWNNS